MDSSALQAERRPGPAQPAIAGTGLDEAAQMNVTDRSDRSATMRLQDSSASPLVRQLLVFAHETELRERSRS